MLADKDLHHVPKFAQQKAKAAAKQLEKLESEAKQKVREEDPSALSVSISEASEILQDARTSLGLLKDLLHTARKHTG